jgi:peptide/nickel transport system substrate-binding protein
MGFCSRLGLGRTLLAALVAISLGCTASEKPAAKKSDAPKGNAPTTDQTASDEGDAEAPTGPVELGDLLEPFDPPPLEELLGSVRWIDRPVAANDARLREIQADGPKPELTVEEALAIKNDSSEANEKISSALGQLAPEDRSGVDDTATFVRHVGGDLKTINPLLMSSITDFEYQDLTGIGLLTNDIEGRAFAPSDVVVSWQSSEDHLYDKFVIRDDLTWSDGKPVTSHDFAFTFKAIMTKDVIAPAVRTGPDELRAVIAYDDHTLVVFHKASLATNDGNMQFYALPKHIYEKTIPEDPLLSRSKEHSRLEDHPVVAGPYELAKRVRGDEFVVRRREGYYMHEGKQVRDKPFLKEVRIKFIEDFNTALLALVQGDIEEMMLRAEQWDTQTSDAKFYKRNTKVTQPEWTEFHFTWNVKAPFFSDPKVRWAMTYAVDYDELIGTLCYDLYEQSRGNFHPDSWMFPKDAPQTVTQDLDRAQELLAEAGWEDSDGDGIIDKEIDGRRVPFEFTMLTYQSENGISTATLMKENLDLLGIVCNVKPTEFTVLQQKLLDHEFEASMGGWGAGKDPATNANIFGSGQGRNYGNYSNPEVDELFEQGKHEFDPEKRAEIYGKIHMKLWEDQPYTWLFYRAGFYAFSKKLRGYNLSPWGPYYYTPGVHSIFAPAQ